MSRHSGTQRTAFATSGSRFSAVIPDLIGDLLISRALASRNGGRMRAWAAVLRGPCPQMMRWIPGSGPGQAPDLRRGFAALVRDDLPEGMHR